MMSWISTTSGGGGRAGERKGKREREREREREIVDQMINIGF